MKTKYWMSALKNMSLAIGLAVALVTTPSVAAVQSKRFTLDNGLTIIVNEMPSTPVAAVYAWVRTGSANEGKYLGSGITHFVEHMIFKGTARRAPGAIPDEVRSMGGYINASTGQDFTVFTLSVPRDKFVQGADLIADMMRNAAFDTREVEREREVILKEMRMLNDKPARKLEDMLNASVYTVHPYRLPIIGRESILKNITRDDLMDYYRTYYAPNNMIVSVSGQFTADEALPVIKEKFGDASARPTPLRNLPSEPEQISPRSHEETYSTDLYRMVLAYQGIPLLHHDLYALDLLANALGSGRSSRFYRHLYEEKQLVNSIETWNDTPMDRGFFAISCLMKDDRREEVIQEIKSIIEKVKKDGLLPEELSKIKRQMVVENIHAREVAGGMAYRTAMEEAFSGDYLFSDSYVVGINNVTNDDVKRVAKEYLIDSRLTEVSLVPPGQQIAASDGPASLSADTDKLVLPNGLTLLLKEDKTLPVVAIGLMMRGGIEQEPNGLEGLASITGSVWSKAYQGISSDELSREIEERGGSITSGSGKNTLGLNMSFLSEDLPFVLNVLEKLVKSPAFPEKLISLERQQMLTAITGRKDSVMQTASKELLDTLFSTHPFRRDGLGDAQSLRRITSKEVSDFYSRFAVPSNMVLAVFGNIDKVLLVKDLQARFGLLPSKEFQLKTFDEPPLDALKEREVVMDKEQAALIYGFRGPTIYSAEGPALEVAVNILSSSLSGRLFKRIREELGKAYAIGGYYSPAIDAGMVTFFSLTTNENISKVRSIMEEELRRIISEPVPEKELADSKAYLKGAQARYLETLNAQSQSSTSDEILGLGYDYAKSYNSRIESVTADALRSVAAKYFRLDKAALVVVKGTNVPVKPAN